jgi:hypothetical protein
MFAKRFEALLAANVAKTDLSRSPDDITQRFESLRGYRLLPAGRAKNVTHLSPAQMAAAILSVATVKPGFAGLAGKVLSGLRPVGARQASFQGCATLGVAVESLIGNPVLANSLLELRVSDSEIYTNAQLRTREHLSYRVSGVSTRPGITALTVILYCPSSKAADFINPRMPHFEAE